ADANDLVVRGKNLATNLCTRGGLQPHTAPDSAGEMLSLAQRPFEPGRGHVDRVFAPVVVDLARDAFAERVVDALGVVDIDAEAIRSEQLDGEHLGARHVLLDSAGQLLLELP